MIVWFLCVRACGDGDCDDGVQCIGETMMMGYSVSGRQLAFRQLGDTQVHRGLQIAPYICFFKENCILYVSTIAHSRELRLHPCSDW